MKNRIRSELARELKSVRVSPELKNRILADAAGERFPARGQRSPLAFLAVAAAVIAICGLTLGVISLRAEKIDRRSTVLSSGSGEWVWISESDALYHSASPCGETSGMVRVRLEQAKTQGREACQECMGAQLMPGEGFGVGEMMPVPESEEALVWANAGGRYYHSDEHCSGMRGATQWTVEQAESEGKSACPVCVGGFEEMPTHTPAPIEVTPEPKLVGGADLVWTTGGGRFYHCDEHCSGMEGAVQKTFAEVVTAGKSACPVCYAAGSEVIAEEYDAATPEPVREAAAAQYDATTPEPMPMPTRGSEIEVWATKGGKYYHCDEYCSGMQGASLWTINTAISDKTKCPVCYPLMEAACTPVPEENSAEETQMVWATEGGSYYHIDEHCSYMQGAKMIPTEQALAAGKAKCPVCFSERDGEAELFGVSYFATEGGAYFHAVSDCSGMENAQWFFDFELQEMGKEPCPVCLVLGEDSWAETIAEAGVAVSVYADEAALSVKAVPDPKLEWIDYGLNRPVDLENTEIAQMLQKVASECMTEDELTEMKTLLEAGEIMGFRCVRYNFFFENETLDNSAEAMDDASGDLRVHLLTAKHGGEVPDALSIGVVATEIACVFHGDGDAEVLTGTIAMVEKSRTQTDEGWLIEFSQERADTIFPTVITDLTVSQTVEKANESAVG